MAKNKSRSTKTTRTGLPPILGIIAWITGVIVSLSVGFGLINGTLGLPMWLGGQTLVGMWVVLIAGWIVVATTLIGAVLAIIGR